MTEIRLNFNIKIIPLPFFYLCLRSQVRLFIFLWSYLPKRLLHQLPRLVPRLAAERPDINQSNEHGGEGEAETDQPIDQERHAVEGRFEHRLPQNEHPDRHDEENNPQLPADG